MRLTLFGALLAAILPLGQASGQQSRTYEQGQVWSYVTRPQDSGSLLRIAKIEADPAFQHGPTYHIAIIGVHLGPDRKETVLQHFPVSRETLDKSVLQLVQTTAAFPDSSEGIDTWRKAKGGVFTISVAEIVDVVDQAISKSDTDTR